MRFSALMSPTWIMPSNPSASCTKAPNLVRLVTAPSTTDPTGYFWGTSAQGSPSACFRPSAMRRSAWLTPRTTTSTRSPGFTTSDGFRVFFDQDISERWIRSERLLQAKCDAAVGLVDAQDHHVHKIPWLHHVRRLPRLLRPGHFGEVDQPFDALFQFHEGAEIGHAGDRALYAVASLVLFVRQFPRMRLELLHAQRDRKSTRLNSSHL